MRGIYRVIVQNKKIKYDFEIRRNITIIRGDSATGKTALVDMIREFYEDGVASGIDLQCEKECVVLEGKKWEIQLKTIENSLVFIDEGNTFVSSKEFASMIQKTDNYYILITRESLETLPYSVTEIYGIRDSGKYGRLKQTYNELYRIYGKQTIQETVRPNLVITEDSNSGFQFYNSICKENQIVCISAKGKSNIFQLLTKQEEDNILVIADGAAFGAEMEKIIKLIHEKMNIKLYLPESFEWIILKSGILKDSKVEEILEEPSVHIESKEYFSWERFFTALLVSKTEQSYLKYSKNVLNPIYTQSSISDTILKIMEHIQLKNK